MRRREGRKEEGKGESELGRGMWEEGTEEDRIWLGVGREEGREVRRRKGRTENGKSGKKEGRNIGSKA